MDAQKRLDESLPVIDTTPMEEAFGEIGEDAIATFGIFVDSTAPILADMAAAIAEGRLGDAAEAAHSAKGAARMTGAFRLAHACSKVEASAKAGDGAEASAWLATVPEAFAQAKDAIAGIARG